MHAQSRTPTLLLTRPAAPSERFAQEFRARFGFSVPIVISPLQDIVPETQEVTVPPARTLILSSENAVPAVQRLGLSPGTVAWCVGPRTARAARDAGLVAIEGPGNARGLAQALIAARPEPPCLFLRGAHVAGDLVATLNSAGIETTSAIVYRQDPRPLTPDAHALLAGSDPVLLPLFSPRSARLAAAEIVRPSAPLRIAALSPAVAAAAAGLLAARCAVAASATSAGMLDALATLLADPP